MAKPETTKPQDAPTDVLVYFDSDTAQRVSWQVKSERGLQVGGVTLTPGLSVVPAARMVHAKATPAWGKLAKLEAPPREVALDKVTPAMIARTTDPAALEQLLGMKPELAKAIEAQLGKLRPAA